jgi:hypothetical protein
LPHLLIKISYIFDLVVPHLRSPHLQNKIVSCNPIETSNIKQTSQFITQRKLLAFPIPTKNL